MDYAIIGEPGPAGEHFIRVTDIDTGATFHFSSCKAKGLRYFATTSAECLPDELSKAVPDQVLAQASRYARERGWIQER